MMHIHTGILVFIIKPYFEACDAETSAYLEDGIRTAPLVANHYVVSCIKFKSTTQASSRIFSLRDIRSISNIYLSFIL